MKFDWLIIGGGIHGVHIAARLIGEAGISPDQLRIVDPGERLLSRWRTNTAATGMTYLRSPSVHHIDLDPRSLMRFADVPMGTIESRLFTAPYDRPALQLFNAHCDRVVEEFGLAELHIRDRAMGCSVDCDSVTVQLLQERNIDARNLVLAIGASEQPYWPDWAPIGDKRVGHLFEPEFGEWPEPDESVVVVGGGISAAQVALRLVDEGHHVRLVSRHDLREHQFDSEPGWLGPKLMTDYSREKDLDRRRAIITAERHRGSVPPDVLQSLGKAIAHQRLDFHKSEIAEVNVSDSGLEIRLHTDTILSTDRLLLATGFISRRPGGSMVDELIDSASLPCASCGYPIVDSFLRWHPRVFVSGPLAELELGPVSRNIAGARRAADRLVVAAARQNARVSASNPADAM